MKYAINYIIFFILPVATAFCGSSKIVGGNCEYNKESGSITITGLSDTANTKIKVLFNYSNGTNLLPDAFSVDSNCISNLKIRKGDRFNCIRQDIIKGTCTPIVYEFDSASCLNYH
jgi:hypothetical protein